VEEWVFPARWVSGLGWVGFFVLYFEERREREGETKSRGVLMKRFGGGYQPA